MGIAQHHDAVSGMAKQHTTDDYSKRLALGTYQVHNFSCRNALVT
jgi:alpha-mannosidase